MVVEFNLLREEFERVGEVEKCYKLHGVIEQFHKLIESEQSLDSSSTSRNRLVVLGYNKHYSRSSPSKLESVNLLQLSINKINRGKLLLVKTVSKVIKTSSVQFVISDQDGNLVTVLNYNIKNSPYLDHIYPFNSIYAILEPHIKSTSSGYSIRIDSPSDLIRLYSSSSLLLNSVFQLPATTSTAVHELKVLGNEAFKLKKYHKALDYYSDALDRSPAAALLSNRGVTYLRLARPALALKDLEKALELHQVLDPLGVKIRYRRGLSLYQLGKYKLAAIAFEELEKSEFAPLEMAFERRRVEARLLEQDSGNFNLVKLLKEEEVSEIADFTSDSISVLNSIDRGGGRGIFATRDIKAGELILVSTALGSSKKEKEQRLSVVNGANLMTSRMDNYGFVDLIAEVVENMMDDPDYKKRILLLHPGDAYSRDLDIEDGDGIDISRVEGIATFNSFHTEGYLDKFEKQDNLIHATSGIFDIPSYLNHRCLGNISYSFIGNVIYFIAKEKVRIGDELFDSYVDSLASYDTRKKHCDVHGFICDCQLCQLDREDNLAKERQILLDRVTQLEDQLHSIPQKNLTGFTSQVLKLAQALQKTYNPNRKLKPLLYPVLRLLSQSMRDCTGVVEGRDEITSLEIDALECLGVEFQKQGDLSEWKMIQTPLVGFMNAVLSLLFVAKSLGQKRGNNWIKFALEVELGATGGLIPFEIKYAKYLKKFGLEFDRL